MAKIFPLKEGSFSVDASKKFIPFDPSIHDPKDRPASLFIHVQPFLVQTKKDLILIDAGLGVDFPNGNMMILENIEKAGFKPEDVSIVLLSHLHYDHIGGLINRKGDVPCLTFPNAEYVIQQAEWNYAKERSSISYHNPEILSLLEASEQVHFVYGNGNYNDEIFYEITGGHCPYHQVFIIQDDNEVIFFGGDILPESEQLLRKFLAKYDNDPKLALEQRIEYGKRAADENWTCLYYHAKTRTISRIGRESENFVVLDY